MENNEYEMINIIPLGSYGIDMISSQYTETVIKIVSNKKLIRNIGLIYSFFDYQDRRQLAQYGGYKLELPLSGKYLFYNSGLYYTKNITEMKKKSDYVDCVIITQST